MTNVAKFKFIQNLEEMMKEKNITQSELARRVGITRASVNGWFKKYSIPKTERWGDMAKGLGCDIKDLLKGIKVEEMV